MNWFAAVALSVGMIIGTLIAVKLGITKGEKIVRVVLGISLLIIAGRLLIL